RLADHRLDAEARQPLRRVLARRPAAEVRVHHENRRVLVAHVAEGMRAAVGAAVVREHVLREALEGDDLQVARRHDAVGVDVVAAEGNATSRNRENPAHAGTASSISRTSATSPAIAAAATIAGLMSSVRPVGLPWRPLKLRFDEDAQTWRPSSLSGFIARHIEQPAPRHSKPASMNTWWSPRRSASRATAFEPGTISAFTCGDTLWPRTIRAASSISERRP